MSLTSYHKKLLFSIKSAFVGVHRRSAIKAEFIFLLALISPAEQNKVVLQTEAPAADVYLDGNLVAKTNADGSLQMENLPSGTFRFMVEKEGYLPYDGSFQIEEGESKVIQVQLSRIELPQSAEIPSPVKKPQAQKKIPPPESTTARQPPEPIPPEAVIATVAPDETIAAPDSWLSEILIFSIASVALLWFGISLVRRRTRRIPMNSPQFELPPDCDPSDIPAARIKPPPDFVDQLKRREELITSGFAPINAQRKDVVIVLPKEAYTSKEE
jgi:hypothetical protein